MRSPNDENMLAGATPEQTITTLGGGTNVLLACRRYFALKLFWASLVNLASTSRMLKRGRFVRYV